MDDIALKEVQNKQIANFDLKFVGSDDTKVTISLKYEERMVKVKKAYAAFVCEDINRLRFMLNGNEILHEETPEYLQRHYNLNENSIIEVCKVDQPIEYINLKVIVYSNNGFDFDLRIPSDSSLGGLRVLYFDHIGQRRSSPKFLFDGRLIKHEDTAKGLEMEEGDVIEVYEEVHGWPLYLD